MAECLFYEICNGRQDQILVDLLEKSLRRGWRVLVRAGSEERVLSLNATLWTYRDDSFLPHGCSRDGNAQEQPIYLDEANSNDESNPNGAKVLILADGGEAADWRSYQRCVSLLDGHDSRQIKEARAWIERIEAEGETFVWWRQGESGWENS